MPVRGEPCEIPDFLAQRSYADISGGSYPLGFKYLLEIIKYYSDGADIKVPESVSAEQEEVEETQEEDEYYDQAEPPDDVAWNWQPHHEGAGSDNRNYSGYQHATTNVLARKAFGGPF